MLRDKIQQHIQLQKLIGKDRISSRDVKTYQLLSIPVVGYCICKLRHSGHGRNAAYEYTYTYLEISCRNSRFGSLYSNLSHIVNGHAGSGDESGMLLMPLPSRFLGFQERLGLFVIAWVVLFPCVSSYC